MCHELHVSYKMSGALAPLLYRLLVEVSLQRKACFSSSPAGLLSVSVLAKFCNNRTWTNPDLLWNFLRLTILHVRAFDASMAVSSMSLWSSPTKMQVPPCCRMEAQ